MEMKLVILLGPMMVMVLNHASPANGDITCQQALMDLMPCKEYLTGSGPGTPPITCCSGVQTVYTAASTRECRRNLCECFKKAAAGMPINPDRLKQLPDFCRVYLPVPLDPKIDCES
ncbi:non-specific lipid-transfer protein 1-like [Pyrus communis]|uniref:non-specific lipid-transfer protein 1-like n=1 Tax=Pyrus communis TaxID=23211 RepID=UPI0035C02D1D